METYGIIMSGEEASGGDKPNFAGKYVLVKNENFDEFLGANGMTLHFCSSLIDGGHCKRYRATGPHRATGLESTWT